MVKSIDSIGKSFYLQQYEKTASVKDTSGFKETLKGLTEQFNAVQEGSKTAAEEVILGNTIDSHDVMIAAQEAGLAFDLMLEVRNKLIEAYQEIMRMQV